MALLRNASSKAYSPLDRRAIRIDEVTGATFTQPTVKLKRVNVRSAASGP